MPLSFIKLCEFKLEKWLLWIIVVFFWNDTVIQSFTMVRVSCHHCPITLFLGMLVWICFCHYDKQNTITLSASENCGFSFKPMNSAVETKTWAELRCEWGCDGDKTLCWEMILRHLQSTCRWRVFLLFMDFGVITWAKLDCWLQLFTLSSAFSSVIMQRNVFNSSPQSDDTLASLLRAGSPLLL